MAKTPVAHWLRRALPGALGLAATSAVLWAPRATTSGMLAAAAGAFAGALAGLRGGESRLKWWIVPAGTPLVAALLAGLLHLSAWLPVSANGAWPEGVAATRDAALLCVLAAAVALVCTFVATRLNAGRVLPAAALVAVVALLLAPHRGGAIHLPHELGDIAWLRGYHPALLLAACGVAAGLTAAIALYRSGSARGATFQLATLVVCAGLLLAFAPSIGLFSFATEDPLGLSGNPPDDKPRPPRGGRGGPGGADHRPGDALGLTSGEGDGAGGPAQDMAPFRDDYSSKGAELPVAVVVLHDDVEPTGGVFYFRQVSFSQWNGHRLVRAIDPRVDADNFTGFPLEGTDRRPAPAGASERQELAATVSLLRDHVQPFVIADGVELESAPNPDPSLFRRSYRTTSRVLTAEVTQLFGHAAGDPSWPADVRRAYLELPPDPRYRDLAAQAVAAIKRKYRDDPWGRVLAVALWLEHNTKYSLHSKHASADDPTASFLFGDRIGYCVHLAHAGAYMMRALGVPARVSAGYAYEAQDRAHGSTLLLRAGDAHAWAEAYLDGVGWVAVDPSPESLDPPVAAPSLDLQRLLGEMARTPQHGRLRESTGSWRAPTWRETGLALLATLVVWFVAGQAIRLWRALRPRFAWRDRTARTAYRAALDRLAEHGIWRQPAESRERLAQRAASLVPSFADLTRLHLAATFGRHAADRRDALRVLAAVRNELKARRGWRARTAPWSPWRWTRSR